ncbi:MAG: arabinan endo-1,5-alpha-L-arabinosidase [Eubacterium sp.]|nr:arabinan endo-1,5-alpha-L-arabinosidase [Eubacterium sp.]
MTDKIIYPAEPPKQILKERLRDRPSEEELGLWFTHDPAIYQDDVTGMYYIYGTGAMCQKSKDLVHWERVGKIVENPPKEAIDWVGGSDIWAPDIVKVGDEYRLYCSNSTFGVQQSDIFLAVADSPEGPFVPRGIVLKSSDQLPVNAIDANIITDRETGEMYMVYGSFWGGIHALKLDKETGLAAEEGIGVCLARRPAWLSTAIEGPYVVYNEDTGYYYLFVSYGSLKSDYQVRVGRSKHVLGPYVDYHGREMTDVDDADNTIGHLAFCGYQWNDGIPYMAPGHNSVLRDKDGSWYLLCHIREKNFTGTPEPSTMQVRKMFWTESGWPVLSPERYAGEVSQPIPYELLQGRYERINLVSSLPQGIQTAVSMKLEFENHYYECCSIQGTWSYEDGTVEIQYGPHKDRGIVTAVWDWEKNQPTIAITGMGEDGVPFWAKRVGEHNA